MFKLGDFVRFVDEKREGYVTKVIDPQTLGVTDTDGFEIPVLASNLTYVHGKSAPEKSTKIEEDVVDYSERTFTGILLAMVSDKNAQDVIHFNLVNDTADILLASVITSHKNRYTPIYHGIIVPFQSASIHSASLIDLNSWPEFEFQVLVQSKADVKPTLPLVFKKSFRAKDFSGEKKSLAIINQKGWQINLTEPFASIDPEKLKESFFKGKDEKKIVSAPLQEVDLHIEKLRNDYQFLKPEEILQIQMAEFERNLEAAIVHKFEKIIFIHGSGNGTLRNKIHRIVSGNAQVKTFMDGQKEKFGYGATEVFLK
ncbi:hypothetical protein ABIB40_001264 [Pedobacter sp. UYP30]|uniref:Smr/MutS family protein n=1 Tax=Pedobacter sp. UYP30 TaxID=1756400 RepID=UPI0033998CA9